MKLVVHGRTLTNTEQVGCRYRVGLGLGMSRPDLPGLKAILRIIPTQAHPGLWTSLFQIITARSLLVRRACRHGFVEYGDPFKS